MLSVLAAALETFVYIPLSSLFHSQLSDVQRNSAVIFYTLDVLRYAAIKASHTSQKIQRCSDLLPVFIIRKVRLVRNRHDSHTTELIKPKEHHVYTQNQNIGNIRPHKAMLRKWLGKHQQVSVDRAILSFKATKRELLKTFRFISARIEAELQQLWAGLQLIQANW